MKQPFFARFALACATHKGLRAKVEGLMRDEKTIAHASRSQGRAKGGGRSSKAKGRSAVTDVRDLLYQTFDHLAPDDILVKATSMGGADLHFSPFAQSYFPFDPEVKNVEALNIWAALAQARANADRHKEAREPIVFFKRANSEMFVALNARTFLKLLVRE
jgi:hypothetical protein